MFSENRFFFLYFLNVIHLIIITPQTAGHITHNSKGNSLFTFGTTASKYLKDLAAKPMYRTVPNIVNSVVNSFYFY